MDAIHEWYDNVRAKNVETRLIDLKIAISQAILDAENLLVEHQKQKNEYKDEIDRYLLKIRQCENEILILEEEMKWANEVIYALKEWVNDGE
jgi:hypothetical protein